MEKMPASWQEKVKEFDRYLKVERGIKGSSRLTYAKALVLLGKNTDKSLSELEKGEIIRWKEKAMDILSNSTLSLYTSCIKKFFQWLYKYDEGEYPTLVKWMKAKREKKLKKFDLTVEDIKKLVDACNNQRDRCLIMLAYDTGCRAEELLQIKLRDLRKDDKGYRIWLQGGSGLKTGERTLRIYPSIPDLELWLSMHPYKDNLDAYLFPSRFNEKISYSRYRKLVEEVANRAKIKKHVNPHSFRHLRATELCNTLSDAQMKARFGWTMDSRMLRTYEHQAGIDVDECFFKHYGIETKAEKPKTLRPKICPRGHKNSPSALFCSQCGMPLEKEVAIEYERREQDASKLLEKALEDPEVKSSLIKAISKLLGGT
jgi:integrase